MASTTMQPLRSATEPVQLRARQLGRKRCVVHDHARERIACLGDRGARAEQPRDERVLRHRGHALRDGRVDRVAHKVQPRDAQALLVDRVIIERVVVLDMRHADHGIMPVERAAVQADRVVARRDGHVLAVGKFVVQIAAEIKIAAAVCRCGTHGARPPSFIHPVSISAAPGRMLKNLKSSCVQSVSFCARRRRGVALEVLEVGKELAGRLGVVVRRRDGVSLAVVAVGLLRFEHEADVREVRVVGVVVVGAVDRDVLDHQVTPLRDDDTRRILPVREVVVEAHVLLFNRHDLHFTPLAK